MGTFRQVGSGRSVAMIAAVVLAGGLVPANAAQAAAKECRNFDHGGGMGWYRVCEYTKFASKDPRPAGAMVTRGRWSWQFSNPHNPASDTGLLSVILRDNDADGECATLRIRHPWLGTVWKEVCGAGEEKKFDVTLSSAGLSGGFIRVGVCVGKRIRSCHQLLSQEIGDPGPGGRQAAGVTR